MADRERIYDAIRKAHKAGDADAVRKLGAYLQTMDSPSPAQAPSPRPQAPQQAAASQLEPKRSTHWAKTLDDFVRGAADAATFGFADEIAAGANALPAALDGNFSEEYEKNLAAERSRDQSASPWTRIPGQVAGGVATGVATLPISAMAGLSKLPMLARGVVGGAGAGGAYGFGSGQGGANDRLAGAGAGAAIGGAAGAAAPLALGIGKGVYNAVRPSGAGVRAANKVQTALARDNMTPMQLQAKMSELGTNSIPADVGGANVRGLTRAVASVPGRGKEVSEELLQSRQMGARGRATSAVDDAFGSTGDDFYQTIDDVARSRAAAAKPLYDEAYDQPIELSVPLEKFLETPIAQKSFRQAQRIWQAERAGKSLAGEPLDEPQWFVSLMNDGSIADVKQVPNTRVWDYMVRGMDDMLEKYRDKTTMKLVLDTEGRALSNVRKTLDRTLKASNPAYEKAKAAWSGPTRAMSAMERGRSFIKRDAEITAKELAGLKGGRPSGGASGTAVASPDLSAMPKSEREMFGMGVARGIRDVMENVPDGANVVRKLVSTPAMRKKIDTVLDDPTARDAFNTAMMRESTFNKTRNDILAGSRTTPLAQEIDDAGITGVAGMAEDALRAAQGSAGGVLGLAGRAGSGVANRYRAGASERTRDALTDLLFPNGQVNQDALIQALLQRQKVQQISNRGASAGAYGAAVPLISGSGG